MLKQISIWLIACVWPCAAAVAAPGCVQWSKQDASVFQPSPNAAGQISADYGLYWVRYNPTGSGEQFKRAYTPSDYLPYYSNGKQNTYPNPSQDKGAARAHYNATTLKGYYNPNKPTIIFIHGWQPKTISQHARFDFCYAYPDGQGHWSPKSNTLRYWRDWNVAIFYWNQFADAANPFSIERKIYAKGGSWDYLVSGNSAVQHCSAASSNCIMPNKSIAQLAYEAIVNAIPNIKPGMEFRISGQSLGSQIATVVTDHLLQQQPKLKPTRLVLLEPYFSSNKIGGNTIAQHINKLIQNIMSNMVPVSEYRTSRISHPPTGDWNSWLMQHVAYERLYPKYFSSALRGLALIAQRHRSAAYLYFQSKSADPYWDKNSWDKSFFNARTVNEKLSKMLAQERVQQESPSEHNFTDTKEEVFLAVTTPET